MNLGFFFTFILFLNLGALSLGQAQVGSSASTILSNSTGPGEGVAHGRYQIKKRSNGRAESRPVDAKEKSSKGRRPANENGIENTVSSPSQAAESERAKGSDIPQSPSSNADASGASVDVVNPPAEPSLKEQAETLLGSDGGKIMDFYREQIHKDDIRNNKLELQVSPAFVYNGSQSNYSYRTYSSAFSALELSSNIWMVPSIGLYGRFLFSFGASLKGDRTTDSTVPVKYEDLDLGVRFRRFLGLTRESRSLDFVVLFNDSKLNSNSDQVYRPKLDSSGLGLKLISRVPTSTSFAWVFGGSFFPRLQHREEKTGISISSGSPSESTRLGINIGSELTFSRESQVVYDLSLSSEKNAFDGAASPVDPEKNSTPNNVSVTNTFVMFSFGYRWGR